GPAACRHSARRMEPIPASPRYSPGLTQTHEDVMKKLLLTLPLLTLALAGCQTAEQNAAAGALGGAAIGAAVSSDDDQLAGAALGAAAGVAASTLIRPTGTNNQCLYRDQYGRTFEAPCQ
ncbi:MAG: glycine zipper 2TM domain-containing protein, partial [Paracoccaceae bacterium]